MIVFRQAIYMMNVGIDPAEVARRLRLREIAFSIASPPDERLDAAAAAGARYLVGCDTASDLEALRRARPDRLADVARFGSVAAYRLTPAAPAPR